MTKSLYEILNVDKNADNETLKKSYRKMALKHHPDRGGDTKIFQGITEAYEILSNTKKRSLYDMHGLEAATQGQEPTNAQDIFSSFFGNNGPPGFFGNMGGQHQQQQQKEAVVDQIEITMEQVYTGCTINKKYNILCKCNTCNGTGSKTKKSIQCVRCKGTGVQTILNRMGNMIQHMQTSCSICKGLGEVINDRDKCKNVQW